MQCNLCSESFTEISKIISTSSEEGKYLKIQEIIQEHLGFMETLKEAFTLTICRSCCKILCDFHQLYLKVAQSPFTAVSYHESREDHKELRTHETVQNVSTIKERLLIPQQEASLRRQSKRIIAKKCRTHTPQIESKLFQVESDVRSLLEKSFSDVNPPNKRNSKDGAFDSVQNVLGTNETNLAKENIKNFGSQQIPSKCNAKKHPSSPVKTQTQVSKEYDEFLAKHFTFSCHLCHAPLSDFTTLKKHFRKEHHACGYVVCCGKKLLKRGILVDHVRTHLDPEFFKCQTCSKVAASRRCLEMHLQLHEQKPERSYQCHICSKSYFRRAVLMRHMQMHVPEEQKKIRCPRCEKVFATNYLMNQHLKLVHLNTYARVCEVCGKSIKGGREAFQSHQLEHTGVPKPLIQCTLCTTQLSNKYGLARHMKSMHTNDNIQPQVCNICSKVSATMSAHRRHIIYVHKLERKHTCCMCSKAFKRAKSLTEHMTTHTGEVLYTCPHCPKTFNSSANMHSHRKKAHRKQWEEQRLGRYVHGNKMTVQKNCSISNLAVVPVL